MLIDSTLTIGLGALLDVFNEDADNMKEAFSNRSKEYCIELGLEKTMDRVLFQHATDVTIGVLELLLPDKK